MIWSFLAKKEAAQARLTLFMKFDEWLRVDVFFKVFHEAVSPMILTDKIWFTLLADGLLEIDHLC